MIMKKVFGFIAMALAIVACNKNEMNVRPEEKVQEGTITITAQLAPKGEITKAVSDQGTSIKVDWAVDEHMAILYDKDGHQKADARITAVDGTGKATIEFAVVEGTADNTACTIVYPYAAAKDDNSGAKTYAEFLSAQNGTLNANLDVRIGAGKIQVTTPGLDVTTQPAAQYSIFKFTLTTDGTTPISANGFFVRDGNEALITNVTLAPATNSFFVAIPAKTSGTSFKFIASDETKLYTKSISTTAAIEAGTYYQTPLNMGAGEAVTSVNLATVTTNRTFGDFVTLIGTLNVADYPVKISIADGATVTLNGVTINGSNNDSYNWAGITCEGDATIILSGANTVNGFYFDYPGIYVPVGKTLTIQGTGSLNASSNGWAAGIGGGFRISCGNIEIQGGTVTVTSGASAAGIGSGYDGTCGDITISGGTIEIISNDDSDAGIGTGDSGTCGDITISGGTITASGGDWAAGIGSGYGDDNSSICGNITISGGTVTATGGEKAAGIGTGDGEGYTSKCGNITILNTVTQVTAIKGSGATNSIGAGVDGTCGTVTIGGVEGAITTSPYTYEPLPEGALSGKFTINGSGDKVRFSQGNLQWSGTYGWRFAPNQWSYIGENANNDTPTVSDGNYLEFFCWGATGLNGVNPNTENSYLGGSANLSGNNDWGANAISNGGNKANSGWRTLSTTEWQYLFDSRTNASDKYAGATVNGIHGILLLPDSWTLPDGCAFTAGQGEGWSTNTYDTSQWDSMEASGAVFLPAAGFRYGDWILAVEDNGYYWSSTANNANESNACGLFFYTSGVESNSASLGREYGMSVRLVRNAN